MKQAMNGTSNDITVGTKKYQIKILYLAKKHSSITIKDSVIVLRISKYLNKRDKQRHINILLNRIKRRLHKSMTDNITYDFPLEDGQILKIWGQSYMLHLDEHPRYDKTKIKVKQQAIFITTPLTSKILEKQTEIKKMLRRKLSKHLNPKLENYITNLNDKTIRSKKLNKIRFKEQSTRWGSCSSMGNINISSRMLFLPLPLLRYVCLHELCHLKHPNHSSMFWKLVYKYMTDYKQYRERLKSIINLL